MSAMISHHIHTVFLKYPSKFDFGISRNMDLVASTNAFLKVRRFELLPVFRVFSLGLKFESIEEVLDWVQCTDIGWSEDV